MSGKCFRLVKTIKKILKKNICFTKILFMLEAICSAKIEEDAWTTIKKLKAKK